MRHIFLISLFLFLILSSKIIYAGTIKEINKRGALRVCALSDRLPFSSRDTSLRGFQIELAEEIAKDLGVSLEINWLRYRFHARKAGCDMMMEAVSRKNDDANKRDIEGAKPLTRASDSEKRKFPPTASIPIVRMETYLVGPKELVSGKNTLKSIRNMNIGAGLLKKEIRTPENTPPIVVNVASTTDCPVFSTAFCIPSGEVPSSLTLSVI